MKKPMMSVFQTVGVWYDKDHTEGYSPKALCESYGDERDPILAIVDRDTLEIVGLYSNYDKAIVSKFEMEKAKGLDGNLFEAYALTKVKELV